MMRSDSPEPRPWWKRWPTKQELFFSALIIAWGVLCFRGIFCAWLHPEMTNTQVTRVVFFLDGWPE